MMYRKIIEQKKIWVISSSGFPEKESAEINSEVMTGFVSEYKISDLALYLINPSKIEITEKIVGYEIHYKNPERNRFKNRISHLLSRVFSKKDDPHGQLTRKVIDPEYQSMSPFKDDLLESVFSHISDLLLTYSPVIRQLNKEDDNKIDDIYACCEDPSGNNHPLKLTGSISEKIKFIKENLYQTINIKLKKAYMRNGVFEMRGFDFADYDADRSHRLVRFDIDNKPNFVILDSNNTVKFKIDGHFQIKFLHLLQHALGSDTKLFKAFQDCLTGNSQPYKLLFSKDLSAKYTDTYLPKIFQSEMDSVVIDKKGISDITDTLNRSQRVVSFNTITTGTDGDDCLFTTITIMHDLRELRPLKNRLPELYMKIEKNVPDTELGRLYLLDSISGAHLQSHGSI